MDLVIVNVPLFYGCDKQGVEESPQKMAQAGLSDIFVKCGHKIIDVITLDIPEVSVVEKFADSDLMKYLSPVVEVTNQLSDVVIGILKRGLFPLVIGGDHSIALGSVKGTTNFYKNLGVIWLDAHGDMNTSSTSPTGNIHGMPLASLMNLGDKRLRNHINSLNKINPHNIFLVGARALDIGEKELVEREKINVFSTDYIKCFGVEKVVTELKILITNNHIENLHFSIDIDVLDPRYAPGTGVKEQNGINPNEFLKLIAGIISMKQVKVIDFVEYNYKFDCDNITLNNSMDALKRISEIM